MTADRQERDDLASARMGEQLLQERIEKLEAQLEQTREALRAVWNDVYIHEAVWPSVAAALATAADPKEHVCSPENPCRGCEDRGVRRDG